MNQLLDNLSPGMAKIPPTSTASHVGNGAWPILSASENYQASTDAALFSNSLPVLPHEKLILSDIDKAQQPVNDYSSILDKVLQDARGNDLLEDFEAHAIENLLPNDNELFAGVTDDFELSRLPGSLDDVEDDDVFDSGGGIELENDPQETMTVAFSKVSLSDGIVGNGVPHYGLTNGTGTFAGEHPYGEHPSRTLFVRNINSNVEDSELRDLFEQYGDIRTLYTACKHRGFVMISYFDIRAARTAMRALQNKPLRRRKLDIHFSIPKDNPSDKDVNQGTLVVFNLDPSVSNEDLRQIFGAYGEVKEIRETPHKRHHKFIEFYDVRAAEAALKSLNRSDIAGKRIKLEPSRPGGARRNLMLQLNQELDQDDSRGFHQSVGSPIANSPPANWAQFSPIKHSPLQSMSKSPIFRTSPTTNNHLSGLASILHLQGSNSGKIPPIGKDHARGGLVDHAFSNINSVHGGTFQHSHSLPESRLSQYRSHVLTSGPSTSNGSGMETLSGPQFLWGSPNLLSKHPTPSAAWQTPATGQLFSSTGKEHGFSYTGRHSPLGAAFQHQQHHGSAPSGVPLERHIGFFPETSLTPFTNGVAFRGGSSSLGDRSLMMNMGSRAPLNTGSTIPRNICDKTANYRIMSSPRLSPVFVGNGAYPGFPLTSVEGFTENGRSRKVESNGNQIDNKKQFQLDLDKIISGEDTRTTLMIKNIPNKYTSKMLLAAIDEHYRGTYDFFYLPIDFKNKCNVGYAFINMLSPQHIISFYKAFNGKRWEKFNSEKVASLAYARIQGKAALVSHFQNSSLMNEDKRCRPILFHSEVQDMGDRITLENLPPCSLNIQFRQPESSQFGDAGKSVNNCSGDWEKI